MARIPLGRSYSVCSKWTRNDFWLGSTIRKWDVDGPQAQMSTHPHAHRNIMGRFYTVVASPHGQIGRRGSIQIRDGVSRRLGGPPVGGAGGQGGEEGVPV